MRERVRACACVFFCARKHCAGDIEVNVFLCMYMSVEEREREIQCVCVRVYNRRCEIWV